MARFSTSVSHGSSTMILASARDVCRQLVANLLRLRRPAAMRHVASPRSGNRLRQLGAIVAMLLDQLAGLVRRDAVFASKVLDLVVLAVATRTRSPLPIMLLLSATVHLRADQLANRPAGSR